MKVLRIVFCILACGFAAAAILVGVFFGLLWALACIGAAALCGVLMFFFKRMGEPKAPPPGSGFLNGEGQEKK